ncbi:uncharacterized protein LOC141854342 [Brevipalpus obovatus]|uniref:uncharacterized protein LOC141854342 n=1 Tax=Brevipalpus obovatus TaxID=246614 RepID=UPI003D9EEAF4
MRATYFLFIYSLLSYLSEGYSIVLSQQDVRNICHAARTLEAAGKNPDEIIESLMDIFGEQETSRKDSVDHLLVDSLINEFFISSSGSNFAKSNVLYPRKVNIRYNMAQSRGSMADSTNLLGLQNGEISLITALQKAQSRDRQKNSKVNKKTELFEIKTTQRKRRNVLPQNDNEPAERSNLIENSASKSDNVFEKCNSISLTETMNSSDANVWWKNIKKIRESLSH